QKAPARRTSPSASAARAAAASRSRAIRPPSPTMPRLASPCRKGNSPVSSRLIVIIVPFVVIAIFWLMARREAQLRHDPTHKGYFERNGMTLGILFIVLVALWTLFLVVLPYLYMVVESFHPQLPPTKRGGPEDMLTLEQY